MAVTRGFRALPGDRYKGDIPSVTAWSKLDMTFDGVSVDTFLEIAGVRDDAACALARSHTGHTANLPVERGDVVSMSRHRPATQSSH